MNIKVGIVAANWVRRITIVIENMFCKEETYLTQRPGALLAVCAANITLIYILKVAENSQASRWSSLYTSSRKQASHWVPCALRYEAKAERLRRALHAAQWQPMGYFKQKSGITSNINFYSLYLPHCAGDSFQNQSVLLCVRKIFRNLVLEQLQPDKLILFRVAIKLQNRHIILGNQQFDRSLRSLTSLSFFSSIFHEPTFLFSPQFIRRGRRHSKPKERLKQLLMVADI